MQKEKIPTFLTKYDSYDGSRQSGSWQEDAHAAIKEHALATVKDLRRGKIKENDLVQRLSKDKRIGLNLTKLRKIINAGEKNIGAANQQVDYFIKRVKGWARRYSEAKDYAPESIL